MTVWIEADLCNGCRLCLKTCPYGAVDFRDARASINDRCTSCGACVQVCKQGAILSDIRPRTVPDFSDRKGVWVFAEQRGGVLERVSLELLGKARELGEDLDEEVSALLLGNRVSELCQDLIEHGADRVYLAEHEALEAYRTLPYTDVLQDIVEKDKPNILLMGATHIGRDLAPRLSRRLGAGLTADCTELSIEPKERILLQTRPAFGGNVMATITSRYSRPQMATVRPGVMELAPKGSRGGEVVRWKVSLDEGSIKTRIRRVVKEERKRVDLTQAKVIVSGGRGVGDAKGFKILEELADVLGGEMAGTRVAVEEGWIPPERQVGQTGQTVRPELYIACGISGAIQHRAGMMHARYVVAINRDPRAPIFQVSDWGIVGDLHEVVPELIARIREEA